jgi:hypothetical protein
LLLGPRPNNYFSCRKPLLLNRGHPLFFLASSFIFSKRNNNNTNKSQSERTLFLGSAARVLLSCLFARRIRIGLDLEISFWIPLSWISPFRTLQDPIAAPELCACGRTRKFSSCTSQTQGKGSKGSFHVPGFNGSGFPNTKI